jgi:SSS family solute:Na+ symporter
LTTTKADDGTLFLDLGEYNFPHHTLMLGVYSHIIVLVVGFIASRCFKTPLADKNLTIYGYLEERRKK